jgi:hypothetical protein
MMHTCTDIFNVVLSVFCPRTIYMMHSYTYILYLILSAFVRGQFIRHFSIYDAAVPVVSVATRTIHSSFSCNQQDLANI